MNPIDNMSAPPTRSKRKSNPTSSSSSSSWRSLGWKPLSYPLHALFHWNSKCDDDETQNHDFVMNQDSKCSIVLNPFFPLHRDVLVAAVREMLLLEGVLDPCTLTLLQGQTLPSCCYGLEKSPQKGTMDSHGFIKVCEDSKIKNVGGNDHHCVSSGEEWVQMVVDEIKHHAHRGGCVSNNHEESNHKEGEMEEKRNEWGFKRQRIRKVSDVSLDIPMMVGSGSTASGANGKERFPDSIFAPHVAVVAFNLISGLEKNNLLEMHREISVDISRLENILQQLPGGLVPFDFMMASDLRPNTRKVMCLQEDIPNHEQDNHNHDDDDERRILVHLYKAQQLPEMLDLSIMMETYLRNIARNTVRSFTTFLSDKALREFLGYKSPTAKIERVLDILADFLFDVSHAMFAWEKTEADLLGDNDHPGVCSAKNRGSHDLAIRRALFDKRSLIKIGGFEPDSLLYHALSIGRLRRKGESWESFAKTQVAKKMFSHHQNSLSRIETGMKRRAKRMKKNASVFYPIVEDENCRSRSSSMASMDSKGDNNKKSTKEDVLEHKTPSLQRNFHLQPLPNSPLVPDVVPITITREEGNSWGILLAKEGSMCVVMRVPNDSELSVGDLIVSVRNERSEFVSIPSKVYADDDWFSDIVCMFKKSNMLHLEVRRVSSSMGKKHS